MVAAAKESEKLNMKIIFAGTPDFAVPALQALIDSSHDIVAVYTQPDRHAGRGQHVHMSPVKELALKNQLTVCQPKSLRDVDVQNELANWQSDVMVVAAYGLLLPPAVLTLPRYGCINIHASLLPRWRGASPIQRAILSGDKKTGITIMQMDEGLDTGDMIAHKSIVIAVDDTAQTLHDKLAPLGSTLLLETLTKIENSTATFTKQNDNEATLAPKIKKTDGEIDWQQSAEQIALQVRAFNPWPVAFTHINDQVLRVWYAEKINAKTNASPGTVIKADHQGLDVATGEGVVRLLTLQAPGSRKMSVNDFYNARQDWFREGETVLG